MPQRSPKVHELVRERLSAGALARGRQLYLSSGVRELRIDVRRRRYSAIVDDEAGGGAATVKIEQTKGGPTWVCSVHGRDDGDCAHVAALLTGIREREAIEGDGGDGYDPGARTRGGGAAEEEAADGPAAGKARRPRGKQRRVSLVEHLLGEADREHLVQAFRLCLKTYPELQGDLVFTILENIDADGELYGEVVRLMSDPAAPSEFSLPREGFDPYRLLDEINYLYEQEKYEQCFLLSRAMLTHLLAKLARGKALVDHEVDLVISSSGLLSDLTIPPAPEHLVGQVHELGLKLLRRFPKLEPQIQSSLVALIDDESLGQADLEELEKSFRRRWNRARKSGDADDVAEAERLAMPLALFYARTQQFDKLQNLFERYLQNPLLRAPALAEMLHHNLHELVAEYVMAALVEPGEDVARDDAEDAARCGMYNDLVMMVIDAGEDEVGEAEGEAGRAEAERSREANAALLRQAFVSIGHRIYGVLDPYREHVGEERYREELARMADELAEPASRGVYVATTKYFVLLSELERYDEAFAVLESEGSVDPVILLDYLPHFLPKYQDQLFEAALQSIVELLPIVSEDGLRDLVRGAISRLWDIDEAAVREVLDRHFVDIVDDELADYVDALLGDLDAEELEL